MTVKNENLETDPPKTDPPKTDPPKTDPPKTDPPKTDPPKTDPPEPKVETPAEVIAEIKRLQRRLKQAEAKGAEVEALKNELAELKKRPARKGDFGTWD